MQYAVFYGSFVTIGYAVMLLRLDGLRQLGTDGFIPVRSSFLVSVLKYGF
jgi:hypothetical protein